MVQTVKKAFSLVRREFCQIVLFEILLKLFCAFVLWPACSLIWRVALSISGVGYVSIDKITVAALNPIVILAMIIIGSALVLIMLFEISALIGTFKYAYYDDNLNLTQMVVLGMKNALRVFMPYNLVLIIISVFLLALMNMVMGSSVVERIVIPEYIQLYIDSHTALGISVDILWVVIFIANIVFMFIYNFFFCGHEHALSAAVSSFKLLKGRVIRAICSLALMKIIVGLAISVFILIVMVVYGVVMYYYMNHSSVMSAMWTVYSLTWPIFLASTVSITVVTDYAALTTLYYKFRDESNNPEVLHHYQARDYAIITKIIQHKKQIIMLGAVAVTIAVAITFVLGYLIFHYNIYDELYTPIQVTAHRGNSTEAVPNTLPAFQKAIEQEADFGELDVRQTKDNEIVVTHDASIAEMTGKDINVRSLTYEELEKIPCKEVNGVVTHIAKLEDVIKLCKGRIKLNIEIKTGNNDSEDFVRRVVDIIEKEDFVDNCVVTSLDYSALKKVKQYNSNIKTGYIMAVALGDFYDLPDIDFFSMETTFVNARVVEKAHSAGKEVHVWTANTETSLSKCVDLEVDNIITDDVPQAKEIIATHGNDIFSVLLETVKELKPIEEKTQEYEEENPDIAEDATGIEAA